MRKILRSVLDFFIFSNIAISVCGVCVFLQGYLLTGRKMIFTDALTALVFFSTIFTYVLIRVVARKRISLYNRNERWDFFFNHYGYMRALLVLSFLTCVVLFFFLKRPVQIALLVPGFISVLYGIPLYRKNGTFIRIRDIGITKIFLISFVWAYIGSVLPVVNSGGNAFSPVTIALFFAEFLFIFALDLPFDIRDIEIDTQNNVRTIPVIMGVDFTQNLSLTCLFINACLQVFIQRYYQPAAFDLSSSVVLSDIVTGFLIIKMKQEKEERFYLTLLDGAMIVQFALIRLNIYIHS